MANNLTLILTLYNPSKKYLKRWSSFSKKISKMNNVSFMVVNDNTNENFESYFKSSDLYFNNVENVGKFASVYNFVKAGKIKTTFFKTVDPDDYIDIKKLKMFLKSASYNDWNIIRMQPTKFTTPINFLHWYKKYTFNEEARNFPTYSTILPTKLFIDDKLITEKHYTRNFIEDQLLGIIAYINGGKIVNLNYSWYKYWDENGVTSQFSNENVQEILKSMETFWDLCIKTNTEPPTSFPGNLDYIRQKSNESKLIDLNLKSANDKELLKYTTQKMKHLLKSEKYTFN